MSEETILFYEKLFATWIQQQEKNYKNIDYFLHFKTKILKEITTLLGFEITYDLRAYEAILNAISQPKHLHYSKRRQNSKRSCYRKIAQTLFQCKFIDKRHHYLLIEKIDSEQNWLATRLHKFYEFLQVSGKQNVVKDWQSSMKMNFKSFWQAIKTNHFYSKDLKSIFGLLKEYLTSDEAKIASYCLDNVEKVRHSKKQQASYQSQSGLQLLSISSILTKDSTEQDISLEQTMLKLIE